MKACMEKHFFLKKKKNLLIINYIPPLLLYNYMIIPNTVSNDQHIYFYVPLSLRFTS